MKNTILLMTLLFVIPCFTFGRDNSKKKNDNHESMFVIRPGEETIDDEDIDSYYYPGENGIAPLKKKKDNGPDWKYYEIRFDGSLSKGIGGMKDTNGNYHISALYHYSPEIAFGAGTGLYYSVGPYATHGVPLLAMVDYNLKSYLGFTPYFEAYGGYMIGFRNASHHGTIPSFGIFGAKAGISYNIYKSFHIRLGVNFFNTTNCHKVSEDTAESCIGPFGSIGYRF